MQLNSTTKKHIPSELMKVYEKASRAIAPIKPTDENSKVDEDFLFTARETNAGHKLPPYFLVYFLLVDLLGFRNLGQSEKIDWSVPIDFNGHAFLIEHRKFGIGVFTQNSEQNEDAAHEIVNRIHKAVKAAQPFFDWMADEAVASSNLNVVNNSAKLFARYEYLRDIYQVKADEAIRRKSEIIVQKQGQYKTSYSFPAKSIREKESWLAISMVEAFFSWSEHALIHVAILTNQITSASEITATAEADWASKFKCALDINDPSTKRIFDNLLTLRSELRNYVTHGAFGKQGEAFYFHSSAGAVPVLLPHRVGTRKYRLGSGLTFDAKSALETIETFIEFLWSGLRKPAKIYIQESYLPTILTLADDGSYDEAMSSIENMNLFVDQLAWESDTAANMDW